MIETVRSEELFERARQLMPGGVNSPVRAFGSVGGTPRMMVGAKGAYLTDADGREYVDLVCSWGPALLGHAHPAVLEAVHTAVDRAFPSAPPPPPNRNWRPWSSAGSPPSSASAWSPPAPRPR